VLLVVLLVGVGMILVAVGVAEGEKEIFGISFAFAL
jgi:hypothetical protein